MAIDELHKGGTVIDGAESIETKEINKLIYLLGLPNKKVELYSLHPLLQKKLQEYNPDDERKYILLDNDPTQKEMIHKYPIGRANQEKKLAIKINDPTVSSKHCTIRYKPEVSNESELANKPAHFYIIDESSNGTRINGDYYDEVFTKRETKGELRLVKGVPFILPIYRGESAIISLGKQGMDLEFRVK